MLMLSTRHGSLMKCLKVRGIPYKAPHQRRPNLALLWVAAPPMTVVQNCHTAKKHCVLPVRVGQSPPGQGEHLLLAPAKGSNAYFLELGRNDHLLERNAAEESFFTDLRQA